MDTQMKRILFVAAGYFALAGASMAADMPIKAPLMTPPPSFSWTGIYLGFDGGYGWGTGDQTAGVGDPAQANPLSTGGGMPGTVAGINISGGVYGGHFGFNYQLGSWVLGLEVSAAGTSLQGNTTQGLLFPTGATSTVTWNTKLNWQATATPRLGWAWGTWLLYAKGGLAAGGADVSASQITGTLGAFAATQQRTGWTAGVGLEYAWTPNWILGVEYDFIDLGTQNFAGIGVRTDGAGRFFSENVQLNYSEILGRISYKF
jgi:outer membrane immunogenic protein